MGCDREPPPDNAIQVTTKTPSEGEPRLPQHALQARKTLSPDLVEEDPGPFLEPTSRMKKILVVMRSQ